MTQSVSLEDTALANFAISRQSIVSPPPVKFAQGSSVVVPNVKSYKQHGTSANKPSSQYIKMKTATSPKLPSSLLTVGVNGMLSTNYAHAPDTGVLPVDDTTRPFIDNMKWAPHLSRDGGKGGYLNGQQLFIFCDTGSYSPATTSSKGDFLGFVSSSVAVDKGLKGLSGEPVVLEDGVGQWSDDVGRMRGMWPLTNGEQAYNYEMQGNGQRYAIWAESSIVPYNRTHALLYAPIVYDNVNRAKGTTVFTYTGMTLLLITAPPESGPRAERIVDKLFWQTEQEWGSIAGLRSYGPAGPGGNDGRVYVFGKSDRGLLLARVDVSRITDRDGVSFPSYSPFLSYGFFPFFCIAMFFFLLTD
jgi:hypothetical protein